MVDDGRTERPAIRQPSSLFEQSSTAGAADVRLTRPAKKGPKRECGERAHSCVIERRGRAKKRERCRRNRRGLPFYTSSISIFT